MDSKSFVEWLIGNIDQLVTKAAGNDILLDDAQKICYKAHDFVETMSIEDRRKADSLLEESMAKYRNLFEQYFEDQIEGILATVFGFLETGQPSIPRSKGKIVFSAQIEYENIQVFSVNADGSNLTQLTKSGKFNVDPIWSPNGKEIFFSSDLFAGWNICIMDAGGGNVQQITKSGGGMKNPINFFPSLSPDGQWIAFQSDRETRNYKYGRNYRMRFKGKMIVDIYQLYMIDRNGDNLTRITNDPFRNDMHPSWSPDGKKIIFDSVNVVLRASAKDHVKCRIEAINPDGTSREIVAEDKSNSTFNGYHRPSWSPLGNRIAFSTSFIENGEVFSELCAMDVNGKESGPIKRLSIFGSNPRWSPDGNYLVFDSNYYARGKWAIYIANIDGNEIFPLVDIPYSSRGASWI